MPRLLALDTSVVADHSGLEQEWPAQAELLATERKRRKTVLLFYRRIRAIIAEQSEHPVLPEISSRVAASYVGQQNNRSTDREATIAWNGSGKCLHDQL